MQLDRVLSHTGYNLRSVSHLSARDMPYLLAWTRPSERAFGIVHRLHKQRAARRKELYESLFVIDRLAPELARARAICDLGAGHGLVGLLAAVLYPNIERVHAIDRRQPPSFERVLELLVLDHLWLKRRVTFHEKRLDALRTVPACDLVVGIHCCGSLTDHVARLARDSGGLPFALAPCCEGRALLPEGLELAGDDIADHVNAARVAEWRRWGYEIEARSIPERVTPRHHLYVGRRPTRASDGAPEE